MTAIDTSTEAVERLMDGVTPGPWAAEGEDQGAAWGMAWSVCRADNLLNCVADGVDTEANVRFIAAARDLVPALLKERDEARVADTVTLVFSNADATPKNVRIICDQQSIAPIMAWYGAYHAGDRYTVTVDGRNVRIDNNGEPINE